MTQILSAKSVNSLVSKGKERYEVLWTIPDWKNQRTNLDSINSQRVIFETGSTSWFQSKWLVGLKEKPSNSCYDPKTALVYWQLLDIRGTSLTKLEANVHTQFILTNGEPKYKDEKTQELTFGEIIEETKSFLKVLSSANHSTDTDYIHPDGSIKYKLVLNLKTPSMKLAEYEKYILEQFSINSTEQMQSNFLAILNDATAADFKIVTSDGIELSAHRTILRAQCPVFAGMLESELSETSDGFVKLDDISADTMKTILHYFYTGELLIEMDASNIIEFTYAAGKYQMSQVLELLDDLLGFHGEEVSNHEIQLLSLTGKLSLKKAEARFLKKLSTQFKR